MRGISRWLLLVGLMIFQAQSAAGVWLSCKHDSSAKPEASCHFQSTSATGADAAGALDCAKCRLAAAIGVAQSAPPADPVRMTPLSPALCSRLPSHFYRFFPDPANRPPIPAAPRIA